MTEDRRYELRTTAGPYGFGRTYHLSLSDGETTKEYWLGQDAKVFSRILGMDMRDAVDYFSEKAGSKDFEDVAPFIAEALINTFLGNEADEEVTKADIKKLMTAEPWGLAAE